VQRKQLQRVILIILVLLTCGRITQAQYATTKLASAFSEGDDESLMATQSQTVSTSHYFYS